MKRFACIVYIALSGLLIFNSCIREDISGNTPEDNFEALWKIIDEQYCFLDYKNQEYGLDWNEVHERYARRITSDMTWENLFEVLSDMVNELRDVTVSGMVRQLSAQFQRQYSEYLSGKRLYEFFRTNLQHFGEQHRVYLLLQFLQWDRRW